MRNLIFIILGFMVFAFVGCEKSIEVQKTVEEIDLISQWEKKGYVLLDEFHPNYDELMSKLNKNSDSAYSSERASYCQWAHRPDNAFECPSSPLGECKVFVPTEEGTGITACLVCVVESNPDHPDHGNSDCF